MRARAIVVAAAVLLMASCGLDGADEGLATYKRTGSGGHAALLSGTLTLTDGCLYVVDEFGASWVPVFPRGEARLRDGELTYANRTVPIGQVAELGGGQFSGTNPDVDWEVPEGCRTEQMWIVSS